MALRPKPHSAIPGVKACHVGIIYTLHKCLRSLHSSISLRQFFIDYVTQHFRMTTRRGPRACCTRGSGWDRGRKRMRVALRVRSAAVASDPCSSKPFSRIRRRAKTKVNNPKPTTRATSRRRFTFQLIVGIRIHTLGSSPPTKASGAACDAPMSTKWARRPLASSCSRYAGTSGTCGRWFASKAVRL